MPFVSLQLPKCASFFRKLCKIRNKFQDKGISREGKPTRDKRDHDTSIPVHPQPVDHPAGDEGHLGISVLSQAPSTTPEPQFTNRNPGPPLVDHSAAAEGDFRISILPHAPSTPEPQFIDQDARDERDPYISIPVQASTPPRQQPVDHSTGDKSHPDVPRTPPITTGFAIDQGTGHEPDPDSSQAFTTPRPQSVDNSAGDECHSGVPILPQTPPTTSEPQTLESKDGRNREATRDSKPGILITLPTTDKSPTENAADHVQNKGAKHRVDPDLSSPKEALSITNVDRGDRIVQSRDAPSTSFFQGSSNVEITGSSFYEVRGNATIIRFGDGQFTDVQRNLICDYIANLAVLPDINDSLKNHVLTQSIKSLPHAEAVFDDYQTKKKSGPCFEGTRVVLLREMANWITGPDESRMYVLSGLAGIGKSTVAYTIASRAADLNLLGASFFFSRDDADRKNAKIFFTTIAYQLCVYNDKFAKAIGDALATVRGSAVITKDPQEQLKILILDPLRSTVQSRSRPILIVVDALDECDKDDEYAVVKGLSQLVRLLPSFKVILTTRPQPRVNYLIGNHDGHKIFHLQDIEDKVVDGDIWLYLSHGLSQEQVRKQLLNEMEEWCASDKDIESLVKAAGRLFIIASTAILYVLNKQLNDPAARMKKLLGAIAQDRTPFNLDRFYSIIVHSAIEVDDDDDDDVVNRYKIIVGTIVVIQTPLPVTTLSYFIGEETKNIYAMLRNLQSVIVLGSGDVPRIYHKSFPDYLMDQKRYQEPRLQIDPKVRHTQIATRCFEIMDERLKYNILGLTKLAQFMTNKDGLKEDGITDDQFQKKIPQQLHYACVFWVNHLEVANIEDADLMDGLTKFVNEHMLHWFEVLSLIGKLDLAHRAIRVLKHLKSMPLDLHQLVSDALRFISKFYETIKRSALHTYYSALPFTPTGGLLYHQYIKDAEHNICDIEGGPEKWDALVANLSHEEHVQVIKFSLDSTLFVSCSEEYVDDDGVHKRGKLKIWDAATGIPISTIPGDKFAVAKDFSTIATSEDNSITYYDMNGNTRGTMFTTPSKIQKLTLSSESSRVAAALSDGAVLLWDIRNARLIYTFDGFEGEAEDQLDFSSTGTRLAYSSANGIVKLQDGIRGRFIAELQCGSGHDIEFSGDGSRIASLSCDCGLTLWNSESGRLIGAARDVIDIDLGMGVLAISANGSLLATADRKVKLWSAANDSLAQLEVLEPGFPKLMAFLLDNILAIATDYRIVKLYNIKTRSFIATLPFSGSPTALACSPDYTHLVVGNLDGSVCLWNIRGIDNGASSLLLGKEATVVTALALSRDCSRLACGFGDGTIELCSTSLTERRIRIASHQVHKKLVRALVFVPDGELFASGSGDGTIKLWNGKDASLRETLRVSSGLRTVSVSNTVVVAGQDDGVTLWSLDTLILVHTWTFTEFCDTASIVMVSIAENSAFIAVAHHRGVSLLDVENHTTMATFDFPEAIHTMTFLHDNSQLVAQSRGGVFRSFNLTNKHIIEGPTLEHLIRLPNIPLWRGVPVWHYSGEDQYCCSALISQHKSSVPVLWIPRDLRVRVWTQGPSLIALGCDDGRVILLRLHTR